MIHVKVYKMLLVSKESNKRIKEESSVIKGIK